MDQSLVVENESAGGFDVKRFLVKLAKNYLWIIAALIVFLGAARLYLMYKVPLFQVSTYILLDPQLLQNNVGENLSINDKATTIDETAKDIVNNNIFIIHSRGLVSQIVDSLSINIALYHWGTMKNEVVNLDDAPFTISVKRRQPEVVSPLYKLLLAANGYSIQYNKVTATAHYGYP